MAGLLGLAISSTTAQSTDVVQRATVSLKATVQTASGAKTAHVANKDIIAALNASGAYNFGPNATLLLVVSNDQPSGLLVQDGNSGQTTNTDVSGNFVVSEIGDEVRSPDGSTIWQTWNFGFDNGSTNAETAFELWGATTIRHRIIGIPGFGGTAAPPRIQCSVKGVGRLQGAVTVFSGTISSSTPFSLRIKP